MKEREEGRDNERNGKIGEMSGRIDHRLREHGGGAVDGDGKKKKDFSPVWCLQDTEKDRSKGREGSMAE